MCECIDGGFGAKCDQCDFGYIGEQVQCICHHYCKLCCWFGPAGIAPNCTRCHQCFFLWNDILQGTRNNVTFLLNRIREVLAFYDGFNVSEVENTVAAIQATVASISQSLNGIMPNESISSNVEMMLMEVSLCMCTVTSYGSHI